MTGPKPLHVQRSDWHRLDTDNRPGDLMRALLAATAGAEQPAIYTRNVNDGRLAVIVTHEDAGWHLSISFRDHRGRNTRYPSWDEITDARYNLAPTDIDMVMHLPPPGEYTAIHDTTFHLWESHETCPSNS